MITRSYDGAALEEIMRATPSLTHILCDIQEWARDEHNIALEKDGSFGVFEYEYPGVYTGHYFFKVRGKEAFELAQEMLKEVFLRYGAQTIRGLTPIEHKGAIWLTKRLGFQDHGVIDTIAGPCIIFTLGLHGFFATLKDQNI